MRDIGFGSIAGFAAAVLCAGAAAGPDPSAPTLAPARPPIHAMAPEALRALTEERGFAELERAYRSELQAARTAGGAAPVDAARSLAALYAEYGLHAEAAALLAELDVDADPGLRLQAARSLYAMGRHAEVVTLLEGEIDGAEASALIARAAARLGADSRAMPAFVRAQGAAGPDAEYFLLLAESALGVGDLDAAEAALGEALRLPMTPAEDALRSLHAARLLKARGREAAADELLRDVAAGGVDPAAARAALLRVLSNRARHGREPPDFDALALRSDDPRYRRALAFARAESPASDPPAVIAALREIAEGYPHADDSAVASRRLRRVLPTLFAPEAETPPIVAAKLFFENIDYAPPGDEGDRLIRRVADRLMALDLGEAAAELLEHQVFQRLRGFERSTVAADLAEIYLSSDRPQEALRVIRSTRIAGLDEETNARRRLLEARALDETGAEEMALILLERATSFDAAALKAEILWRAERWDEAGAAYAALISGAGADDRMTEYFVRAGVAYAMAEDAAAIAALLKAHRGRGERAPAFARAVAMIESLENGALPDEARAATGEPTAVRRFLEAYRALYDKREVHSGNAG